MRHLPVRLRLLARSLRSRRPVGVPVLAALAVVVAGSTAAYTVQAGDTLSQIAAVRGITMSELVAANGLDDPNLIRAGQVLTIPGQATGAASTPSTASAALGGTHVIKQGETLSTIAALYGIPVAALASANGLTDPNLVKAGFQLRLDDSPPPTPGTSVAAGGTHTVRPGDTLSEIAASYGTTTADLVAANGINDPARIVAGQQLTVPSGSSTTTVWTCPVAGATYVNDFGYVKPDGRSHEGIDMFAWQDAPITAPVGGQLRQVEGSRAGMQFTLVGDDGITYIGAHMSRWGGSGRVEQGEIIGYVGTSGNARGTTPHTHFEMHANGVMSPYPSLQQYCG